MIQGKLIENSDKLKECTIIPVGVQREDGRSGHMELL